MGYLLFKLQNLVIATLLPTAMVAASLFGSAFPFAHNGDSQILSKPFQLIKLDPCNSDIIFHSAHHQNSLSTVDKLVIQDGM